MRGILRERFGMIHGESKGTIARVVLEQEVVWQSEKAVYSYLFFRVPAQQTVSWHAKERDHEIVLSMDIILRFSNTPWGKISEWYFVYILQGKQLVFEHSLKELEYVKKAIEA